MKSFLVGLGLGVGLGVLFAPMSGEQTRRNITDRANDLAESARETGEQIKDRVRETGEQIKDRVRSGISSIRAGAERATGTEGSQV
jgi:gas vesicle protein